MPSEAETPPRGASWWTLGAVCVAVFMLLLDITVVNVALPDIQRSLDASFSDLQWVVDAYSLTLAALLLTAGSLADRLGRRRIFTTGLVLFTLASVGCGLAGSPLVLNLARGVQGIGGAAMFATSLALIASTYHGRARGIALSVWGATIGVAVAIGPLIGGLLTESLGWEWIFFVNVPIGIGAVLVTVRRVGESRDPNARGIDWAGLVTFSGALFLLVFALVRGNAEGWGSPLIVGFLAGAAALCGLSVARCSKAVSMICRMCSLKADPHRPRMKSRIRSAACTHSSTDATSDSRTRPAPGRPGTRTRTGR